MRKSRIAMLVGIVGLFVSLRDVGADSLWERRNPYFANMMWDTKARRVGDVLTVVLSETTTFDGREDRKMKKETNISALARLAGNWKDKSFAGSLDGSSNSQRELNGKADYRSERSLNDRMAVKVVGVEPNGNLIVEGLRTRVVANEERTMRVSGTVRPNDIGANNTVQSQYIADFTVEYMGRGPESSYTNNGWLGRVFNKVWPY